MELVIKYILLFFIYAFIGWCIEVVAKIIDDRKFVNRGFLIGPILPIYGIGVLLILLVTKQSDNFVIVFLKAIGVCSILEYFTSWIMEVFFKTRWWDYSRRKFNINGRICINTMLPFGILGLLVVYVLNPFFTYIIDHSPYVLNVIITGIFVFFILLDFIITLKVLFKIKKKIRTSAKDNTAKIRTKISKWLEGNSYVYRRLKKSFPDLDIRGKIDYVENGIVKTVLIVNDSVVDLTNKITKIRK
jgi:uncharacterized membrane protein